MAERRGFGSGGRGGFSSFLGKPEQPGNDQASGAGDGGSGGASKDGAGAEAATKVSGYTTFTRSENARVDQNFAKFEQHTKGIGMKLMQKMGWKKGEGLGRARHGIVEPVQAKVRKPRQGMQEKGERTKQSREHFGGRGARGDEDGEDEEDEYRSSSDELASEDEEGFAPHRRQRRARKSRQRALREEDKNAFEAPLWRARDGQRKKASVTYRYVTAERLLGQPGAGAGEEDEEGEAVAAGKASAPAPGLKIVDMTGPQVQVRSILSKAPEPERKGPMPELQHNLSVLLDLAETDVHTCNSKVQGTRRQLRALETEAQELDHRLNTEQSAVQKLERLLDKTALLAEPAARADMLHTIEGYAELQAEFPREYRRYGLDQLAHATAIDLFSEHLKAWNPLSDPARPVEFLQQWEQLLPRASDRNQQPGKVPDSTFDSLVWRTVLPHVRTALVSRWKPRTPSPATALLDALTPFLAPWMADNIARQLMLPRVQQAVQAWDPRTDTVPIHVWLHPLLPYMHDHLQEVYSTIRFKLAACLRAWQASDTTALAMIKPWHGVWRDKDMHVFLSRAVVPKLKQHLNKLVVNPANQDLSVLDTAMAWKDLLSGSDLVSLWAGCVFPKLLRCLCKWMMQEDAAYDEIADWYLQWKRLIPKRAMRDPTIQSRLHRALMIMDRALDDPSTLAYELRTLEREAEHMRGGRAASRRRTRADAAEGKEEEEEEEAGETAPERKGEGMGPHEGMRHKKRVHGDAAAAAAATRASLGVSTPRATSVRDLVARAADASGVIFAPKQGRRTAHGQPLYSFGSATLYIDKGVIFVRSKSGQYMPTSLEDLPSLAHAA